MHPLQKGQSTMEILMLSEEGSQKTMVGVCNNRNSDTGFLPKKKKKQHPVEDNVGIFVGIPEKFTVI